MKKQTGVATLIQLIALLLLIAGGYGWIANLVKLIHMLDGSVTAWFVARAIGVFAAPLGAILGYF